jgi:chemotaxis protein CheC
MKNKMGLSEEQLDALTEVENIGAAHASAALEQMLNMRVSIAVPKAIYPLSVEKLSTLFGDEGDPIILVFFRIFGDAKGKMLLGFTEDQALLISNTLLGIGEEDTKFTKDKESALKEVGNILTGSYLNAISKLVDFNLVQSIPYIAHDMIGAVLSPFIIEISKTSDYALVIETEFLLDRKSIAGTCLTIFDRKSFIDILKALDMHRK